MVAGAESLEHRHATAPEHAHLAGLRAGAERQLFVACERRDPDRRSERRLRDREIDGREDVVALADETRIAPHVHLDVDVAGS